MNPNKTSVILQMAIAVSILIVSMQISVPAQVRIKVHKPQITVFPPDDQGLVLVYGAAGAVERTSASVPSLRRSLPLARCPTMKAGIARSTWP